MHGCSGLLRSWVAAATVLAALQTPACASDWVAERGRLRHRETGLSLADAAQRPGWSRVQVEGAPVAYRGPDGAMMSFLRACGPRRESSPRLEARHLLLGLDERRFDADHALRVAGAPGWLQALRARDQGREAHLKTVTRLAPPCREDWVLVTPGAPGEAEEVFDAWWGSYRPPPGSASARGGGGPPSDARAEPAS